ncbi:MAG: phosphoribosylformylglycinamidine synthase subunit PurL [Thermoplasmata archaeon]|nr:MAG: phosphoribosylformylglycinamidine synthase subunit PurL [Thermoplasmata archaeon]
MYFNERQCGFPLLDINLRESHPHDLEVISKELALGLSVEEMTRIQEHFRGEGRNPTDVEMQALGQAWSEHCCYKSSLYYLKEHILMVDNDDVIARDDAGVMAIDDEWAYALRIESHNHPSAIEPYGGAATGIGGIIRDVLCMGAQPVALVDPLYFGPLEMRHRDLPVGVKHPKYLMQGVVAGIRDYGNRIGIPTVSGGLYFDPGYVGNCIVNVGCLGVVRRDEVTLSAVKGPGDVLILVGGKTGRDGIHGVTFASTVLTEKSEEEDRGAVQLGDPITKEPLIHACLEVNQRGLLRGMKDLGGGGLSCVCGEIAHAAGYGVTVDIGRVPTKEEGLEPWEIWVSESQERMMLAVDPEDVEEVLAVFDLWDVEATVLGHTIREQRAKVYYHGVPIVDMDLNFYTKGPEYCRPYKVEGVEKHEPQGKLPRAMDYGEELLGLLGDINLCNREYVIRQYDHQVRGATVVPPLAGTVGHAGPQDACVLAPIEGSSQGIAISTAFNPRLTSVDPHRGGLSIVDEMCRNLVAVGARPHSMTNCLNFGNPEVEERLGEFVETLRGMGEALRHLNLPAPSGNVSFYNETAESYVPPTASMMGAGLMADASKAVTSDLKKNANRLYMVGKTRDQMAGSALYARHDAPHNSAPGVVLQELSSSMEAILKAASKGMLKSCHDVSDGGLAVALAEMCIGGQLGAEVDIAALGKLRPVAHLFSESNTRWVIEVTPGRAKSVEKLFKGYGVTLTPLGKVAARPSGIRGRPKATPTPMLRITWGSKVLVNVPVADLEAAWNGTFWELMG